MIRNECIAKEKRAERKVNEKLKRSEADLNVAPPCRTKPHRLTGPGTREVMSVSTRALDACDLVLN